MTRCHRSKYGVGGRRSMIRRRCLQCQFGFTGSRDEEGWLELWGRACDRAYTIPSLEVIPAFGVACFMQAATALAARLCDFARLRIQMLISVPVVSAHKRQATGVPVVGCVRGFVPTRLRTPAFARSDPILATRARAITQPTASSSTTDGSFVVEIALESKVTTASRKAPPTRPLRR